MEDIEKKLLNELIKIQTSELSDYIQDESIISYEIDYSFPRMKSYLEIIENNMNKKNDAYVDFVQKATKKEFNKFFDDCLFESLIQNPQIFYVNYNEKSIFITQEINQLKLETSIVLSKIYYDHNEITKEFGLVIKTYEKLDIKLDKLIKKALEINPALPIFYLPLDEYSCIIEDKVQTINPIIF